MALSRAFISLGLILLFGWVGCQTPVTVAGADLPVKDYSVNVDGQATVTRVLEVGGVPFIDFTWEPSKSHAGQSMKFKQVGRAEIIDLPAAVELRVGTQLPIQITRDYHQVGDRRPQELPVHVWRYVSPAAQ